MKRNLLLAAVCIAFALALDAQTTQPYPQNQTGVNQPGTAQPATNQPAAATPGQAAAIPAGTQVQIRTNQAIDATKENVGQQYSAEIADNILDASGNILVPKGSQAQLTIANVGTTQKGVGSNEVSLALQSINVGGRTFTVQTNPVTQQNERGIGANKRTAEMTGGGAVLGTVIGAVAGGGKGAAIGAAVGGASGAAAQVATRGNEVKVPAETVLTFKLDQSVTLQ